MWLICLICFVSCSRFTHLPSVQMPSRRRLRIVFCTNRWQPTSFASTFFKHMSLFYISHLLICSKSAFKLPDGIKPIKATTLQTIVLLNTRLFWTESHSKCRKVCSKSDPSLKVSDLADDLLGWYFVK